jgi:hypothetical protein
MALLALNSRRAAKNGGAYRPQHGTVLARWIALDNL